MTLFLLDVTGKNWSLGRCLGRGGFAKVYETDTDPAAVVKVFKNKSSYAKELFAYQSLFSCDAVADFKRKRGLGHLGFPKLITHGGADKTFFIVIQKLFPIKQLIEESYRENNLVMMIVQLLDVLEFLHQSGWTHNDIKYDNIMIDRQRNYYLIDFGLVTTFVKASEKPIDDPVLGTKAYMSLDAHRGFKNPPRGDLVNLVFMLKIILTAPWDVDKHVYSYTTALLIEKEAFCRDPRCGSFTAFCKVVCSLEYLDKPDYQKLKKLLPSQEKVDRVQRLHNHHLGIKQPFWVFAIIFQTHILPQLFYIAKQVHAVQSLKQGTVTLRDLMYLMDAEEVGSGILDGLDLLNQNPDRFSQEAGAYVTSCVEQWIVHVALQLKDLIEREQCTVNRAIYKLTRALAVVKY